VALWALEIRDIVLFRDYELEVYQLFVRLLISELPLPQLQNVSVFRESDICCNTIGNCWQMISVCIHSSRSGLGIQRFDLCFAWRHEKVDHRPFHIKYQSRDCLALPRITTLGGLDFEEPHY
jgi:hypothetical protein